MKLSSNAKAGIGLALIAVAGPAGFLLYRSALGDYRPPTRDPLQPGQGQIHVSPPPGSPGSAPATPASSVPSSAPGSAPAAALPTRLPDLALADAAGRSHRLSDYRGKPLLLNFWASWCEPCRREIPLLEALHRSRGDAVQVVGVAVDFRSDALKFAQAQGIDYPLLMGENGGLAAANAVGVGELALPFTVITDGRGDIVTVKLGELHQDEADLILTRLTALEGGQLTLPAARQDIADGLRDLAVIRAKGTQMGAN